MRFLFLLFLAGVFISCVEDDPDSYSLQVGQMLPEFVIKDNHGNIISPASLAGKLCVLSFVNTGCPDCRKELPELQAVYESFKDQSSVCFLAIGRNENADKMAEYWKENMLSIPYSGQDSDFVFKKFALAGIPRIYIVNGSGMIVYAAEPETVPDMEELCREIRKVLKADTE